MFPAHLCMSKPNLITEDEVKTIPTKALLDIYHKWAYHTSISDYCDYDCMLHQRCVNVIRKNAEILKAELDTREHVPNKLESKAIRKLNKKRGPKKEKCCRR